MIGALAALTANAQKVSTQEAQFIAYLASQGKSYPTRSEFASRFNNWKVTDDFIKNYPPTSFELSHNRFSDLSESEKSQWLARKKQLTCKAPDTTTVPVDTRSTLPPNDCSDPKCKICSASKTTCTQCRQDFMTLTPQKCSCPAGRVSSLNNAVCCPENCTACGQDKGSTTGICNACKSNFTLVGNECQCYGTVASGVCTPCPDDTFWDKSACVPCGEKTLHCSECADLTAACSACEAPYQLNAAYKTCVCPAGYYDNGSGCDRIKDCTPGEYYEGESDSCVACGTNCDSCDDLTGACSDCDADFPILDVATSPQSCTDTCTTPIEVYSATQGTATVCWSTPFSESRLISPYPADATYADWRTRYVVGALTGQEQGNCVKSGWAFAASGALESANAINEGLLYDFSEQYLINCDLGTGQAGCGGGKANSGLAHLQVKGAILETDYQQPKGINLKQDSTRTCTTTNAAGAPLTTYKLLKDPGFDSVESAYVDEDGEGLTGYQGLKTALKDSPVTVSFEVAADFLVYRSGVYQTKCGCDNQVASINHEMLAVGFGVEKGLEYVLVRNSWGSAWGEQGYARIHFKSDYGDADETGVCGLYLRNYVPSFPCSDNCNACKSLSTCTSCDETYEVFTDGTCVDICDEGTQYRADDKSCQECEVSLPNCETCNEDGTTCIECADDFEVFTDGTCVDICDEGTQYRADDKSCEVCEVSLPGCVLCDEDGTTCTDCAEGFDLYEGVCYVVCNDDEWREIPSYECLPCINGCDECTDGTTCDVCDPDDYFLVGDSTCREVCHTREYREQATPYDCLPCINGCDECTDGTTCDVCNDDYFLETTDNTCVPLCDDDQYRDTVTPYGCLDCITGCDECTDGTTCVTCNDDYFLETTDNTCVLLCGDDQYRDTVTPYGCLDCINGCDECTDGTTCVTCNDDYFLETTDNTCVLLCDDDQYRDTEAPYGCLDCMTGCGSCTDGTTCVDCYSDAYDLVAGDNTCKVKCPPGKLRDESTSPYECTLGCIANCDECSDATTCDTCADGYYVDDTDDTCATCPTNCETCTSDTACDTCADGWAGDVCDECATGYYEDATPDCVICPDNCEACDDATTCTDCAIGFSGTLCDACATGFIDSDADATELECDACETGYGPYPDCDVCADGYEPVASVCVAECGTGKYRDIGGTCQDCVANCDVCVNSTKCTECSATFTLNTVSKLCEAGVGAD